MTETNILLDRLDDELSNLEKNRTIIQAKRVALSVINLLTKNDSLMDVNQFQLFSDKGGKVRANSAWFFEDDVVVDRKAIYSIKNSEDMPLDFKLYGISKPNKRLISWVQALTPNFEDEPFNQSFNVGIDFIIPKTLDKIIVVLSKNYSIRSIELASKLSNTDKQIFLKWTQIKDFSRKAEVHNILWSSFDIKPINTQFYTEVFKHFSLLMQHLVGNKILADYEASLFSNKLIGRVIFCWFLNKKELIDKKENYFDSKNYDDDNDYYRDRLEKLFFEVLSTPINDRTNSDVYTPYLNGGLFQSSTEDLYKNRILTFPKNYFDSLFSFLGSYNFTTDESSSTYQQVAIDPEMLGRIFENLLAEISSDTGEALRKSRGAFYTPREIVDYMCKETVLEYLKTVLPPDEFRDRRLHQLIVATDAEFQDQDHNWRRDWKPYKTSILDSLDQLRVLDPACGSGAFPIGMMQTLLRIYERLEPRFDPYKSKISILERNIFGIDIEPMAIEISRLRAWLSLVVDETATSSNVKPLPNLDFKFICANSLVTLKDPGQLTIGEDPEMGNKLQEIRYHYFSTESVAQKEKLKLKYIKLINEELSLFGESRRGEQLKSFSPFSSGTSALFFDSEEMFGVDKFGIVIGNPPYLGQKKHKEIFKKIDESKLSEFKESKMDLFYYFFHLGVNLLKQGGILSFITTNYFPTATGASKLRQDLYDRTSILRLINFGDFKIFKSALGQHNMVTILKKDTGEMNKTELIWVSPEASNEDIDLQDILKKKTKYIGNSTLSKDKLFDKESSYYIHFPSFDAFDGSDFTKILDKMQSFQLRLKDVCNVNQGIITGADSLTLSHKTKYPKIYSELGSSVFVINDEELTKFKDKSKIKPWFKNSDIDKWTASIQPRKHVLYLTRDSKLNKDEQGHLEPFKDLLNNRGEVLTGSINWYHLHRARDESIFTSPKIICPQRNSTNKFAYTDKPWFSSADVYYITSKDKKTDLHSILALLNSSFYYMWLYFKGKRKGGMLELYKTPLDEIPLPSLSAEEKNTLKTFSLSAMKAQVAGDEQKIDQIEFEIDNFILKILGLETKYLDMVQKFKSKS